ncbi:MAG: lipoyl(octanoyl) transferase LipB [Chthoniobacterales bacterium]|nr:lipoyl(octanoyl) transferase LipB [Chthoniobacterales bacterium]
MEIETTAVHERSLNARWLGRLSYGEALAVQEELVARKRVDQSLGDALLLLEHEPVYTIGRTPDQSSLREASHLPHPLFPINRGGQATYHGPGQLVGYPIIDLRSYGQDLHRYLRWLEDGLIEFLALLGVDAQTRAGLTGVWISDRKIASIGVGVRHWITMHGFALNVAGDLSGFDHIVPCGIANVAMTSIEKESGKTWTVEQLAARAGELFGRSLPKLHVPKPLAPMQAGAGDGDLKAGASLAGSAGAASLDVDGNPT